MLPSRPRQERYRAGRITSLAELVSPEALKRILQQRLEAEDGRENTFNRDLGEALVQIAREWVKVDAATQAELKRLVGKMPMPVSGLTDKNKRFLRQFDDPAVMQRLFNLPDRLWAEVKREEKPNPGHSPGRRWRSPCRSCATCPCGYKI